MKHLVCEEACDRSGQKDRERERGERDREREREREGDGERDRDGEREMERERGARWREGRERERWREKERAALAGEKGRAFPRDLTGSDVTAECFASWHRKPIIGRMSTAVRSPPFPHQTHTHTHKLHAIMLTIVPPVCSFDEKEQNIKVPLLSLPAAYCPSGPAV